MTGDKYEQSDATPAEAGGAEGFGEALQRSPISGMDMQTFRNWLMRALSGDQDVPSSILTRVNVVLAERGNETRERDLEWWKNVLWQMAMQENLKTIDRYIDDLNRMGDELRQRIDENKARMYENSRWIEETERKHNGAAPALAYYKENGVFERTADGKVKNKDAQALLDEYIMRTGQRPESETATALAIERQKDFERQEAKRRTLENQKRGAEIRTDEELLKDVEEKVRRAIERRNEIAEKYKEDPTHAQEEINKLWQEEGRKDITVLNKVKALETSNTAVRREAGDARYGLEHSPHDQDPDGDDGMDLSTFKKPGELAKNFNTKAKEATPGVQVADNAALDVTRNPSPPGPQFS